MMMPAKTVDPSKKWLHWDRLSRKPRQNTIRFRPEISFLRRPVNLSLNQMFWGRGAGPSDHSPHW